MLFLKNMKESAIFMMIIKEYYSTVKVTKENVFFKDDNEKKEKIKNLRDSIKKDVDKNNLKQLRSNLAAEKIIVD